MDAVAWVWCNDLGSRCSGVGLVFDRGLRCFFFLVLTVDYGLLVVVMVVSGVCSATVVVIMVLEQKERERKNK